MSIWGRMLGLLGFRASYDAADTSRINTHRVAAAGNAEPDRALLPELEAIRNRARHELRSNGYARGMQRTLAEDVVGPHGPGLQINVPDTAGEAGEGFADEIEQAWCDWCKTCDLSSRGGLTDILNVCVHELLPAGEFLLQLITAPDRKGVTLGVLPIAPERLETPLRMVADRAWRGGIHIDANGRPIEYAILKQHPGSYSHQFNLDYDVVPAAALLHGFFVLSPGQSRGEPLLTSVLENFGQLREFVRATILAARSAAVLGAGFIEDAVPGVEAPGLEDDLPILDIEPGTLTSLPSGKKISQLQAAHPATTFEMFKREMLSEIGRPLSFPLMRMTLDASKHNFSSARMDIQTYWGTVQCIQALLQRRVLDPLLTEFVREYRLVARRAVPAGWKAVWNWNTAPQVDPSKETDAARSRMASGLSNLAAECQAIGRDWKDNIDQMARVQEYATAKGVAITFEKTAGPAGQNSEPSAAPDASPEDAHAVSAST
mgnify:CR=1 FL=1